MDNYTWRYTELQISDLPAKAQKFIEIMEINVSGLTLALLEPDPHGHYIMSIDEKDTAVYKSHENKIYFLKPLHVGTVIHELTHYYLENYGYDYDDAKSISERFIDCYGENALTNYARVSKLEAENKISLRNVDRNTMSNEAYLELAKFSWNEVVCEIVATYGQRGQFNKIKELFA